MDDLFIKTTNGMIPIDKAVQKKYNLNRGARSPFTNEIIVDEHGCSAAATTSQESEFEKPRFDDETADGVIEVDPGLTFTTAEMFDIAQGVDSYTENS